MALAVVLASITLALAWNFLTPERMPILSGGRCGTQKKTVKFDSCTKPECPPGPIPIPILGNIREFWSLQWHINPTTPLMELARKYNQMCTLWLGTDPVIVINSARVAKDLLDKRGSNYSSRSVHRDWVSSWRLLLLPTGDLFRRMRKLYQTLLSPQQAQQARHYQDFESKMLLRNLLSVPENFLEELDRYALSVIFSAVYGVRVADANHPTARKLFTMWRFLLNHLNPGTLLLDFFPILRRVPRCLQPWGPLIEFGGRKTENRLHSAFLRTVEERIQNGAAPVCFAAHLLQEEKNMTRTQACDVLSMILGAGSDTTAAYLQHFVKLMALHPEALEKAQAELNQVVGCSRLPSWDDEVSLPFIKALIKETHRLAPMAGLGVWHATVKEDEYEGYRIPANTVILPNIPAMSLDPELYPDPHSFKPERFLHHNLDALSSAVHSDYKQRPHYSYGFGRRLCPGMHVAEASLFIVVSRLLWGFNIKPLASEPSLTMDLRVDSLVRRPQPYRVSIESRGADYTAIISSEAEALQTNLLDFADIELPGWGIQQRVQAFMATALQLRKETASVLDTLSGELHKGLRALSQWH